LIKKAKPGYKFVKSIFRKDEEIPEDWKFQTFDESFKFLSTASNARSDLTDKGDINYIHYGDLHTKWKTFLCCDDEEIPFIEEKKIENSTLLQENDLIIADASEDLKGSGVSILLKNVGDKKIVSGLHTFALRPKNEKIFFNFRAYLTSINFVKKQIISYVTGISVYGLSKKNLKRIKILLPTENEQKKIASILFNTNELILSYENTIESTKKFKFGLMYYLLTKGIDQNNFKTIQLIPRWNTVKIPTNWDAKNISTIGNIVTGSTPKTSNLEYYGDDYLWVSPEDIQDSKILIDTTKKLTKKGFDVSRGIHEKSILFVCIGSTIGKIIMAGTKLSTNQQINSLVCKEHDPDFIYYQLLFYSKKIKTLGSNVAVPIINKTTFGQFKIPISKNKDEQKKIGSILSNIDLKLCQLELKKKKIDLIQKALVQKLLTGQIRVAA
jgi:type I restriction enzyme, S subunit